METYDHDALAMQAMLKSIKINKVVRTHQRRIATVNRELQLLRAMLNYAIQNEWLVRNPFSLIKGIISKAAEVGNVSSWHQPVTLVGS